MKPIKHLECESCGKCCDPDPKYGCEECKCKPNRPKLIPFVIPDNLHVYVRKDISNGLLQNH